MGSFKLKLVETNKQINDLIKSKLKPQARIVFGKVRGRITPKIRKLLTKAILAQPEVESLRSGVLAAEFGLVDGGERIEQIVEWWALTVRVKMEVVDVAAGRISIKILIEGVRYDDGLAEPAAQFVTENGAILPWLEWLLRFGDKAIVIGYDVSKNLTGAESRTGKLVMREGKGKTWGVPPEFAGTERNNFVTRAIEDMKPELEALIKSEINRAIK